MKEKDVNIRNIGYTDYPITTFGDLPQKGAPIRRVFVLMYDLDKYVKVFVKKNERSKRGIVYDLKSGYIYTEPKRLDDGAKCLDVTPFGVDIETWLSLKAIEG